MIAHKIRLALHDRVLNVVAEKTGVSVRTISKLKNGQDVKNPAILKVVADYLGVKDDE